MDDRKQFHHSTVGLLEFNSAFNTNQTISGVYDEFIIYNINVNVSLYNVTNTKITASYFISQKLSNKNSSMSHT